MIYINNQPLGADIISEYHENSIEQIIIDKLASSDAAYNYSSLDQLKFELRLRKEIINAAKALYQSGMSFKVFRETTCNQKYWNRMNDGGFALKSGVKPSDAIRDIFINGSMYGTECATAMPIVYYKALLEIFPEDAYNRIFSDIYLMNWHRLGRQLREIGMMQYAKDSLPGDRRYFANPDVNPETPELQGENVIDLGNGLYYGHGMGIYNGETIIRVLNLNRKDDADESAYLMNSAGRPNFKRLSDLYYNSLA
jgi:protein-glutamine gamma-glutamyltransferase